MGCHPSQTWNCTPFKTLCVSLSGAPKMSKKPLWRFTKGFGGEELKGRTLNTIRWQSTQMCRVKAILVHLERHSHLVKVLDRNATEKHLWGLDHNSRKSMLRIHDRFLSISCARKLLQPTEKHKTLLLCQDAFNLLIDNVVTNRLLYPDRFDLEAVARATEDYEEM